MNLSVLATLILLLGASPPAGTRDLQVEAGTAAGAELPELRDAVSRALLVGGARVVMRGPTAKACEYCIKVKVTELSPGVFRIEVDDQNNLASTTLDLSAGNRLLDRARAIAIHARLLVGRSTGSDSPTKAEVRPSHRPGKRAASATSSPIATSPARPEPPAPLAETWPARDARPSQSNAPSAPSAPPERVLARTGRDESKPVDRIVEARRQASNETMAEDKGPAPAVRSKTELAPPPAAVETATVDLAAARATSKPKWPWLPMAVGTGSALAAGLCALVAKNRYDRLADKTQSLESARSLKSSGEDWQLASYILSGVAVAGLGVGIAGFATRSSRAPGASAAVTPIPGGGMAMMAWELP